MSWGMRRTGVWVVAAVVSLAALAACEFPHPDPGEPDAAPACSDNPPGCTWDECGLTCGGTVYACRDGEWVEDGGCDWCLSPEGAYSEAATWRWDQAFDLSACTGMTIEARPSALASFTPSPNFGELASANAADPDLVLAPSSMDISPGYGTCSDTWTVDFADIWIVDGADTGVSGTYTITATAPTVLPHAYTLEGTAIAHVGGCNATGTITGTWTITSQ